MPVPPPVLHPPFNTVRLSHITYTVTDLATSRAFWVDTLGLQISAETDTALHLRAMEERNHHSIILQQGVEPRAGALAFKLYEDADLDRAADWFSAQGQGTTFTDDPLTGRTLHTTDPHGVPLDFYARMTRLPSIHQNYALYHGVKPLRIDHFNLFSPDVDGSIDFWTQMGFRTTEYTEDAETGKCWAAWMHRKGGVHDIAFTNGIGPRLHHTAFWVPTPLNIIDLLDLMSTTGYRDNIERGPGRHGISNAFFLYIRDPDGHRIEIYCSDYQTVDPDHEPIHWDLKDPSRQTLWGAPAPRSWFEEGTLFEGLAPREPALKAQPIVAP
ncbi:3,4-dihydroxyphenylacetate 2,3-dioxygenase [Pseudaestuariivita atlantica]|uniref:3,4-dihydroxyphenylacetate 2,3-dioxygenase n=1 Tax=Pseudaestuariivita atlantica TaxID=1317121 RepID=A0A0L1JT12_9RHOB|nr:3,4-dihydroxyphenylacetate 2,3-dioxygenase [Pseudaestuariivita atlantica]KNG94885.1 3,4-dihydroxyphenylacetate 2,3-dioxygenase [Pseudaestuariivita atlantica]